MNNTSNNPSNEKISYIRENFDYFDEDKNGQIEVAEFTRLLKVIEPTSTPEQASDGFNIIDTDHNGSIDFAEFLAWWQSCWWQY